MIKVKETSSDICNWMMKMEDGKIVLAHTMFNGRMEFAFLSPQVTDTPGVQNFNMSTQAVGHIGGVTDVAEWIYNDIILGDGNFQEQLDTLEAEARTNEYNLAPGHFILYSMGTPDPRSYRGKRDDTKS